MKKLKHERQFLNLTSSMPGCIIVSPYYGNDGKKDEYLDSVTLKIGDCNRTIALDFDADSSYQSMKERKYNLKNSLHKIRKLKAAILKIEEVLEAVELKENDTDKALKENKKKKKKSQPDRVRRIQL